MKRIAAFHGYSFCCVKDWDQIAAYLEDPNHIIIFSNEMVPLWRKHHPVNPKATVAIIADDAPDILQKPDVFAWVHSPRKIQPDIEHQEALYSHLMHILSKKKHSITRTQKWSDRFMDLSSKESLNTELSLFFKDHNLLLDSIDLQLTSSELTILNMGRFDSDHWHGFQGLIDGNKLTAKQVNNLLMSLMKLSAPFKTIQINEDLQIEFELSIDHLHSNNEQQIFGNLYYKINTWDKALSLLILKHKKTGS